MRTFRRLPLWTIILLPLFHCAHQIAPSGGPEDKEGPSVVTLSPPSESVNVSKNSRIIITFSEWLHTSSDKGVSIFPEIPVKIKVKGKRLEIRPTVPLNDSTTYHIVITTGLKDLRSNTMSDPLNIVFSTGPALDSGRISGCVADPEKGSLQPIVALFRAPWQPVDTGFCGPPAYLAQSDSSGTFFLSHVRTGTYYCLAYTDKNGNSRLETGRETLYTPVDSVIIIDASPRAITLYPSQFDTIRQSIASVKAIDNKTIIGYWKKAWDSLMYPSPPEFLLETADSAAIRVSLTRQPTNLPVTFTLLCDRALDSIQYRFIYTVQSIFDTLAITDTLRIDGAATRDTTRPFLKQTLPKRVEKLQGELQLIWSEPVYCRDTLLVNDTLEDSVLLFGTRYASDTTKFIPERSLLPGRNYRLTLFTSDAKDLNDNPLRSRDSTDTATVVTISTIPVDSIAVSLQGQSTCLEESPQRKWLFKPLKKEHSFTCSDIGNAFRFDSLPACKGKIGTFIDYNANNIPDNGRLLPFVAPEPFLMFDDTVEARARWDIEGVELGPCSPCFRRPAPTAADSSDTHSQ